MLEAIWQSRSQRFEHIGHAFRGVGARRRIPPYRRRPGGIAPIAHHMMNMELRHDIAKRRDVELVSMETFRQNDREPGGLPQQLDLILAAQLIDFTNLIPVRNQNEPGIIGIAHQQQPAQGKAPHKQAILP